MMMKDSFEMFGFDVHFQHNFISNPAKESPNTNEQQKSEA